MSNRNTRAAFLIAVVFLATGITAIMAIAYATSTTVQLAYGKAFLPSNFAKTQLATERQAPIATSGNYAYVVWPSNKTTADFEIMFKASTDGGKTFGPKINLSNSTGIDSERPQIAAAGNNVYVSWWERANQTSNEPVLRVSNDNGKMFGEKIMLSK
jgi:hypothetical protein